jgi:hypothetical protein
MSTTATETMYCLYSTSDGAFSRLVPESQVEQALLEAYMHPGVKEAECDPWIVELAKSLLGPNDENERWGGGYPAYGRIVWADHGEDYTVFVVRIPAEACTLPATAPQGNIVEMSLAYEHAADAIKCDCIKEEHEDQLEDGWWDLASTDLDLTDEVAYLDSRRLLQRHVMHPDWVTICDEGEPLPAVLA